MGVPAALGVAWPGPLPARERANAVVTGTFTSVKPGKPVGIIGPMNCAIWASKTTALTTTAGSLSASVASGTGIEAGNAINSASVPPGTTWGAFSGTSGTLAMPSIFLPGFATTAAAQITGLPSTAGLVGSTVTGPNIPANTTVLAVSVPAIAATNDSPGQRGTVQISATPAAMPLTNEWQFFEFALTSSAVATGVDAAASFTGAGIQYVGIVQIERSFDGGQTWLVGNIGGGGQLAQFPFGTPVNLTFGEPELSVLYRLNCIAYTSGTINYRISATGGAALSLPLGSPI